MSVVLDRLDLPPDAAARLRHVLGQAKVLPEIPPAPPGDLVGPDWGNPDRLAGLCNMVASLAPLTIVGAGPDHDGVLAIVR